MIWKSVNPNGSDKIRKAPKTWFLNLEYPNGANEVWKAPKTDGFKIYGIQLMMGVHTRWNWMSYFVFWYWRLWNRLSQISNHYNNINIRILYYLFYNIIQESREPNREPKTGTDQNRNWWNWNQNQNRWNRNRNQNRTGGSGTSGILQESLRK